MFQKSLLLLLVLFPTFSFASELPFTDVSTGVPYYTDLNQMYNAGIITDTSDHLFHPEGLLPRDEFIGTVIGVSCRKCITPSITDIIRYNTNPFIDLLKRNQYFYCISYAKEQGIVQGYVLDNTGKTKCQNNEIFSEVPFCPLNNVSRIEAAAVLLRQAGLWDEIKNSASYEKKMNLPDVSNYWYGYAQKAMEIGLISLRSGKVFPDEYIMRKEFVTMASKIFAINMCQVKNPTIPVDFGSMIKIFDKNKQNCSESQAVTTFPDSTTMTYDFGGYATGSLTPPLVYDWIFTNMNNNEQIVATGSCLDNFNLTSTGSWLVKLVISDANGKNSTAFQQVSVGSNNGISTQISNSRDPLKTASMTLYGTVGIPIPFFSTTTGGDGNYSYYWDFSDGGNATLKDPVHTFMSEGVYSVPLVVRDTSGNIASAQLTVVIARNLDRDRDGTLDMNDVCPNVFGPTSNKGCPIVSEYKAPKLSTLNNLCLENKVKASGMIQGNVQCMTCPCQYASEFIAQIRGCDIVFPSITSPDKKILYSRGGIFQVP